MSQNKDTRLSVIMLFIFIVPLVLLIFIFAIYYWSSTEMNLPQLENSKESISIRGDIISEDGFILANSKKLYKVAIDTRSIDKNKIDIFTKLYSIYTGADEKKIKKLLQTKRGNLVLSFNTDTKMAKNLKILSRKLNQKKVFVPFRADNNKTYPAIGINVIESGEKRDYMATDSMSPILGYVKKKEVDDITRVEGVKGIEKFYDYYLGSYKNYVAKGYRDIGNNIILDKSSLMAKKSDGFDIILNIPLELQKKIENMISEKLEEYDAKEIVVGIMNSKTAQILSLASSRRYNPSKISKIDYKALNASAIEYIYEPGSIIKPIVFSIIYENGKLKLNDVINTHNGVFRVGNHTIRDTHPKDKMVATDIIVHSSNIGMAELSLRIDGVALYDGLNKYKITQKTGIDLPYEHEGNVRMLNNKTHKSSVSYGYALNTTFMQILNAYTAFNNDGYISSPKVVKSLKKDDKFYTVNESEKTQAISQKTSEVMKKILIDTVNEGTGKGAITPGLEIGGKTGTGKIAKGGRYTNLYNSSFIGFANDDNSSYTIGVLVIEPKKGSYYASQNAVPVFKKVVDTLVEDGYLTPKDTSEVIEVDEKELEKIKD